MAPSALPAAASARAPSSFQMLKKKWSPGSWLHALLTTEEIEVPALWPGTPCLLGGLEKVAAGPLPLPYNPPSIP